MEDKGHGFVEESLRLLEAWARHAEVFWYPIPGHQGLGCYGSGFNGWGVQTNQKYLGAMAAISALGQATGLVDEEVVALARQRALEALRFSLRSHLSGDVIRPDGSQWGHTWISTLGVERMMYGVYLLEPYMTGEDQALLRRMLVSESDWLLRDYHRGSVHGVVADPWNHSGKNQPESNIWNGAVLWRTAATYPDHPDAEAWRERAQLFLMNGVSVPADAQDERVVAGRPVKDWHVGAGFFPNYALDHHGYFNVGYMAICLSNAAMLHFDLRAQGLPAPESLYWHNADLWAVLRRLVFGNGRLARLGGDSRIRYVYCQEFLLPTLAYAEDALGERFAAHLTRGFLEMVAREAAINKDGSFYGKRLDTLLARSPYYYTRLESDRACALAMLATYIQQTPGLLSAPDLADGEGFEADVAGIWCEPEHGDVLHRSPQRLASFAWRAHGLTQGMCQPPDDGHLAEWQYNLAGVVRFLGDDGEIASPSKLHRRLEGYEIHTYDGGFCTCGAVTEGIGASLPEQYVTGDSALHQIAFAALPDGNTVVGLQHCRTLQARAYLAEVKGLLLNVPNDLYNAFRRRYQVEHGEVTLACPPKAERVLELGSRWVNVDGSLGVAGIYGAEQLVVHQSDQRRGGRYHSLYVDQVCWHCTVGTWAVDPGTTILDVGWAVLSGVGAEETKSLAQGARRVDLAGFPDVRAVAVTGTDGRGYTVVANFGAQEAVIPLSELLGAAAGQDLISGDRLAVADGQAIEVGPQSARVLVAL